MRFRASLAVAVASFCAIVLGVAAPAGAAVRAPNAATAASCRAISPENITGAQLVNNQIVHGTWTYATGVLCSSNVTDIALYEELDFNGTKVNSKTKGFTGTPHRTDAIQSQYVCAACNGTWKFVWGQIIQAPSGFTFTSPPTGCVLVQGGVYLFCVETKTVTL
jgi:hypothetical protein